jgi:signal transduction histidine kinase
VASTQPDGDGLRFLNYYVLLSITAAVVLTVRLCLVVMGLQLTGILFVRVLEPGIPLMHILLEPMLFVGISNLCIVFILLAFRKYIQNTQSRLSDSEARYRMVSRMSAEYAFSVRIPTEGTPVLEWVTDAYAQDLGKPVGTPIDKQYFNVYHADDRERCLQDVRAALKGQPTDSQYRVLTLTKGERWLHIKRYPVQDATGRVTQLYGVAVDITDERLMRQHDLEAALDHERMVVVRQMISAISHHFRNSLSSIESGRYILTRILEGTPHGRATARLAEMQTSIDDMTRQLDNLSALAALTTASATMVDVTDLVQDVVEEVRQRAALKHIALTLTPALDCPPLFISGTALRSAVYHLVDNALNATPPGGEIDVVTQAEAGNITICVSDTGRGIPEAEQKQIFDLFYRVGADRSVDSGGIGLGLSIVRAVVNSYAGKVTLESAPGKGSTFKLHFPVVVKHLASAAVP